MNIHEAFASALGKSDLKSRSTIASRSDLKVNADTEKQIVQLNSVPVTIDANLYKNARSNTKPLGDIGALFNFSQLVDPIPRIGKSYTASTYSSEKLYGNILNSAIVVSNNDFARSVISESLEDYNLKAFSDRDGTPGQWRPVYAIPEDWHSANDNRFKSLIIDPSSSIANTIFQSVPGTHDLDFVLEGGQRKKMHPNSKINSVEMKYMQVELDRPWYNPLLFQLDGWYLSSQSKGYCSSGELQDNKGVFPLIPISMIIAKGIHVNATWAEEDQDIINGYNESGKSLYLGPFQISERVDNTLKIIGWVSEVIPFSPKISKPIETSIKVNNKGGYVSRFTVTWNEDGVEEKETSGNFPVLANKEISVPAFASNIKISIEIMTFPLPETWSTVKTIHFEQPKSVEYELSGTTFSPVLDQIK